MAEPYRQTPEYDETTHPRNPPNSVANPEVRRNAFWLYLGPILVIAIFLAIAFAYWTTRDTTPEEPVVPTTGIQEEQPGGGSADPRPDGPAEEQEYRGSPRP